MPTLEGMAETCNLRFSDAFPVVGFFVYNSRIKVFLNEFLNYKKRQINLQGIRLKRETEERIEINRVVLGFYNIFTVMFLPVFSLAYSAYI
ncbi:hypothetical protein J4216_04145 [Candidatus Woesearchaeota archaeon]|nr:hypothetical protein [Candidatus Woesearchaeota archaeon]